MGHSVARAGKESGAMTCHCLQIQGVSPPIPRGSQALHGHLLPACEQGCPHPEPFHCLMSSQTSTQASLPSPGLPASEEEHWEESPGAARIKADQFFGEKGGDSTIPVIMWVQISWQKCCAVPRSPCVQMGNMSDALKGKVIFSLCFFLFLAGLT